MNNIIGALMVILFPSLNVFLRDILRNTAESRVFSLGLHGGLNRLGRLKNLIRGLRTRILRRP